MHRTQRKRLHKRKTQVLELATIISCFDRAFLLAGACVRCVKNRIGSIIAFSYAMTACVSCVTCACILLFFCLRNFLVFIAFLAHFLFYLRTFSYARPCVCCVRLNGNRAWGKVHMQNKKCARNARKLRKQKQKYASASHATDASGPCARKRNDRIYSIFTQRKRLRCVCCVRLNCLTQAVLA